ncbi:MAG: TM0106 family RecB-like putative nuclease [Elusimicrobium sp.]|nr:TM0106 family RecB-like putative nuclease [Elusimicrobium sp.]
MIMLADDLYNVFSAGRAPDETIDFHASKMYSLLEDPFGLWCDFHVSPSEKIEEVNRYENLKTKTDRSNRDSWIKEHYPDTVVIKPDAEGDRFKKTLYAMSAGAQAIAGAMLWNLPENIFCSINLLVREEGGESVFGNYHYKIVQLKRAHDVKEHYSLQLALANKILWSVQGVFPPYAKVILNGREADINCIFLSERVEKEMAKWRALKDGSFEPEAHKPPKAAAPPWRVYANKIVAERKDLLMLPHLSPAQREILKNAGFKNTADIASGNLDNLRALIEDPFATESYYTAIAYEKQMPLLKQAGIFPPRRKKYNLYFDFEATETFTRENESFVYLIGLWDKEENKFVSFVAKNKEEEEKIFLDFFNYIKDPADTILYHWTEYEVKKMRGLAAKYPAIAAKLNAMADMCLDLKILVEKAFYLPSPSLSLKAAAPAFGFRWRQDDCGAMDSMVFYTAWQKTGRQDLIEKVLMYNEDDCKAMIFLDEFLEKAEVYIP